MDAPIIISFLMFITVVAGFLAVGTYLQGRSGLKQFRSRLDGQGRADAAEEEDAAPGGFQYLQTQMVGALERMGEAVQPKKEEQISTVRKSLIVAGYRGAKAPMVFFGVKLLFGAGLPLLVLVLPIAALADLSQINKIGIYVFCGVIGLYGPELWLGRMVSRRKIRMLNSFPDALDLLVVCVEAGLGLDAAVSRCGTELVLAHPELADELHMLSLEMRAGLPRQQALTNLGDRIDIDEVRSLVALLIQTDRFGTSVGQALRVYSDAMRTERSLRAEEMAAKLPVKMLFPLMIFIFPSLFIVILGPAVVQGVRVLLPALATKS